MHTLQDVLYFLEIAQDDNKYRHIVTKYARALLKMPYITIHKELDLKVKLGYKIFGNNRITITVLEKLVCSFDSKYGPINLYI